MVKEFLKKKSGKQDQCLEKKHDELLAKRKRILYKCWERFNELLLACPHHSSEMWHGIGLFYDGLNSETRQFVEMMCNGEFRTKAPTAAWECLLFLADSAQN